MSQVMLESSDSANRSPRQRPGDEPAERLNPYASPAHVDRPATAAAIDELSPVPAPSAGEGLMSKSFIGLLITQFLGAMNDNMFRWLIVPIGYELWGAQLSATIVSVGAIMLVLPFLLFAAPAGYLADRYGKNRVMIACKVLEIIVMLAGVGAILWGDVYTMFAVLFCIGAQSALFGPSKYGSIPEIVRADRIAAANGLIGMTTILAIVAGTVAGGALYDMTRPLGQQSWWLWAAAIVGTATVGTLTSLLIRRLPAASPERSFPFNLARETWRDVHELVGARPLFLAALGSALFWSVAGLFQINTDRFAEVTLLLTSRSDVGWLLVAPVVGVGLGNVLAGLMSRGRIELGIVPFAGTGMAVSAILLFTVPAGDGTTSSLGFILSCVWLFILGTSAGMYDVPLQSFLQYRSPAKSRGAILAAASLLAFAGTILASGVFWLLSSLLGMSYASIFLLVGLAMLPIIATAAYWLPIATIRFAVWCISRLMYRMRVEGQENIPKEDGALLVLNHVSWADAPLLALALPRDIRMVAYADYFETPWLRWFGSVARIIPIKPGRRQIVESIRTAREVLKNDELVGIFPEGGITRTGELQPFQPGFLAIMKDTGKAVIPVYIEGMWGSIFSFERGKFFWKWPRRWPYPVTIRFGRPIENPTDPEQVRDAVLALRDGTDDERA